MSTFLYRTVLPFKYSDGTDVKVGDCLKVSQCGYSLPHEIRGFIQVIEYSDAEINGTYRSVSDNFHFGAVFVVTGKKLKDPYPNLISLRELFGELNYEITKI